MSPGSRSSRSSGNCSTTRGSCAAVCNAGDGVYCGVLPARGAIVGPEDFSGRYSVKVQPLPGALFRWISPPSSVASSRVIASPRPVPPYLRLVPASACWNASKISFCFSRGMPMPVSDTSNAITAGAVFSTGCSALQPPTAAETLRRTPPSAVNLKAFDSRFFRICCRRLELVTIAAPESRIDIDVERKVPVVRLVPEDGRSSRAGWRGGFPRRRP